VIDVSCFVGAGPLVAPHLASPAAVEQLLTHEGVIRAGVSPMAGLFRSDPATNDELAGLSEFFTPIPLVDPRWPDVTAHLRRYRRQGCPAVRIAPGSHGYPAADAAELKRTCGSLGLVLVLQMRVADPRNLPPGLDLAHVDVDDATALALAAPAVAMVVAGARATELLSILRAAPAAVLADVSLAEEPDVLTRAVTAVGASRLLVGTHSPFLTPAAARQKLAVAKLTAADREAVSWRNAERLGL
jgi:predicted TIM-barrel fold metal-dependent hydrolase